MLKEAKTDTVSKLIIECDRDVKKLYRVIYNITGKHSINPLPNADCEEELADDFASFFIDKIIGIREELNEYPKYDPRTNARAISMQLSKFSQVSAEDIMSIVGSMASKSCELDVIPTTLFKVILPTYNRYTG